MTQGLHPSSSVDVIGGVVDDPALCVLDKTVKDQPVHPLLEEQHLANSSLTRFEARQCRREVRQLELEAAACGNKSVLR